MHGNAEDFAGLSSVPVHVAGCVLDLRIVAAAAVGRFERVALFVRLLCRACAALRIAVASHSREIHALIIFEQACR